MRCLLLAHQDDEAEALADRLQPEYTRPDGTPRNPMRISEILASRALVALRRGQIEAAVGYATQALDIGRRSIPSLRQATSVLAQELEEHDHRPEVAALLQRRIELLS